MGDNVGQDIKSAFQFLLGTFEDAARLLSVVEQRLCPKDGKGFEPAYPDATCIWNASKSFHSESWRKWIPHYVARAYRKHGAGKSRFLRLFVFIHFSPTERDEPIISFGVVHTEVDTDMNIKSWTRDLRKSGGPSFFIGVRNNEWQIAEGNLDGKVKTIHYQIRHLTSMDSKEKVLILCDDLVKKYSKIEAQYKKVK
jgi:hypothetical protein